MDWLLNSGASYFYPEFYKKFIAYNNYFNSNDTIKNYCKLLTDSKYEQIKYLVARALAQCEAIMLSLNPNFKEIENMSDNECYQIALMKCHYTMNHSFLG